MQIDRSLALRHDDATGAAGLTRFDRLAAGLTAQRAPGHRLALVDQPTQALPTVVDFGAGRAGSAGVARVRVRTADHALT